MQIEICTNNQLPVVDSYLLVLASARLPETPRDLKPGV